MNWIKQNPFLSGLIGGTLVLCGLLTAVAIKGLSKYQDAKSRFEDAFMEVTKSEKLPLYPISQNRQAKIKALDDYSQSVEKLREFYSKYQLDPNSKITTQQFTDHLKAANEEVVKTFKAANIKLPDNFFMGFEAYNGQLAKSGSTALLDYQLDAVRHLLLGMAEARPKELIRFYRTKITEEDDGVYVPLENDVSRKFGYEIVFKGSEGSVRDFINKLGNRESSCYVIRSIRINNEKDTPPRISDAKFEKAPTADTDPGNPFGAAFFDEAPPAPAPSEGVTAPEPATQGPATQGSATQGPVSQAVAPVRKPSSPAPVVDSSRILSQVLGNEELQVFIRFDILLFYPPKAKTKP
jgi:hypothetical protein